MDRCPKVIWSAASGDHEINGSICRPKFGRVNVETNRGVASSITMSSEIEVATWVEVALAVLIQRAAPEKILEPHIFLWAEATTGVLHSATTIMHKAAMILHKQQRRMIGLKQPRECVGRFLVLRFEGRHGVMSNYGIHKVMNERGEGSNTKMEVGSRSVMRPNP